MSNSSTPTARQELQGWLWASPLRVGSKAAERPCLNETLWKNGPTHLLGQVHACTICAHYFCWNHKNTHFGCDAFFFSETGSYPTQPRLVQTPKHESHTRYSWFLLLSSIPVIDIFKSVLGKVSVYSIPNSFSLDQMLYVIPGGKRQ